MKRITLPPDPAARSTAIAALVHHCSMDLDPERRYVATVAEETRSLAQNAYLWGVVYATIVEYMREHHGRDYSDEAVHEALKELFLPSRVEQMARRKVRIYRSTTKLTKREFADYVEHCIRWAAEFGCVVPPPEWSWKPEEIAA